MRRWWTKKWTGLAASKWVRRAGRRDGEKGGGGSTPSAVEAIAESFGEWVVSGLERERKTRKRCGGGEGFVGEGPEDFRSGFERWFLRGLVGRGVRFYDMGLATTPCGEKKTSWLTNKKRYVREAKMLIATKERARCWRVGDFRGGAFDGAADGGGARDEGAVFAYLERVLIGFGILSLYLMGSECAVIGFN
ncbi:hypothetical protein DH2020_035115 [Rehmannia glutinosa]|uniref:Uncharacterized protein n=1 Tax=Rehmannia glutinosa TaxID=99300 RepID=A0ABR0VAS5_REHGL